MVRLHQYRLADGALTDELARAEQLGLIHSPAGSCVTARCGCQSGRPYFQVEDNGPGIPIPERYRVFERFYRLSENAGDGCGLGLAIAHDIATIHDAEITISEGKDGRGALITVTFSNPELPFKCL